MLHIRHGCRALEARDLPEFLALAARDPVVNVFVDYRARTTGLDPRWLGGEVWGWFVEGRLESAVHTAANFVPVQGTPDALRAFAERALARRRTTATIVGLRDDVEILWELLVTEWGPAREVRPRQPHLELSGEPTVEPDPHVRRTRKSDLDALYPACVAMYTEEVGISPEIGGGAAMYRARVSQLVARGWSFARFDRGRVVFKAEVASVSPYAAQIQGVYVDPSRRGEGLAARGMSAVAAAVQRELAPVVSLYVNDHNAAALGAYERAGFRRTATFSTIMF